MSSKRLPSNTPKSNTALVSRANVPAGRKYNEYRDYLRHDFFYSCAYCTMSEAEAQAIRFTIDHYEARKARPDLEHEYSNLMYSCDSCNERKGDRCPPQNARSEGYRFFRPDSDVYDEHFELDGLRLKKKSNTGHYSIEALDLNRQSLRRLREIRERLTRCDQLVLGGILSLRRFPIDQLPQNVKGQAVRLISQTAAMAEQMANRIDNLLRDNAKSSLLDGEDEGFLSRARERKERLKEIEVLFPGTWRAPRKK